MYNGRCSCKIVIICLKICSDRAHASHFFDWANCVALEVRPLLHFDYPYENVCPTLEKNQGSRYLSVNSQTRLCKTLIHLAISLWGWVAKSPLTPLPTSDAFIPRRRERRCRTSPPNPWSGEREREQSPKRTTKATQQMLWIPKEVLSLFIVQHKQYMNLSERR